MSIQNPVFIPGPTNVPEAVRRACDLPTIDHRSPGFKDILHPALSGAASVMRAADAEVFVFPSSGTGGWEAAITNTLSPGDAVVAVRNGMFSHRWIDLCRRHGLDVTVLDVAWGEGAPLNRIEETLQADGAGRVKAVLATHNETATGVRSDIAGVRGAMDAAGHGALLMVDGVSSIGSMEFRFDDWRVDVAVTGSQKGFMMPSGLAIVAMSPRAAEAEATATLPRTYFDVRDMRAAYAVGGYPYTPSVGMLNGLKVASEMLLEEGLEAVFARHTRIADGVRAAVSGWGMELCAVSPDVQSDTVSAIRTPEGFDAGRIPAHAAERYGVAFGGGLGEVAEKVFRIGHLGMLTETLALGGIATAEMVMVDLGLPVRLGSGVAAAQEIWRHGAPEAAKEAA